MYSESVIIIVLLSLNYASCWSTFRPLFERSIIRPVDISGPSSNVTKHWITLPLDHFNSNEKRTFKLKYFQRLDMWQTNGPVYLWIDYLTVFDNYEAEKLKLDTILPVKLAKETNGSLYLLNQRYFIDGNEMKLPHDKDYFKFLNTTQSLADIADFIKFIKSIPEFDSSKVVIVGTGQTGSLGTWFRMLYPDLVDAVLAVSAPLLAKKDFKEYYDIVHDDFEKYGTEGCIEKMEVFINTVGELFNNATSIEEFKEICNICDEDNFTLTIDRQFFMECAFGQFGYAVSYGKMTIREQCHKIPTGGININVMSPGYCIQLHMDFWSQKFFGFPYLYRACSAFGQFPTTSEKTPFVYWNPLEYFIEKCNNFFGIDEKKMDEGILETNQMFGGLSPNVTNVVFTWGDMDPNRLLGVQKNLSESAPAFVINGVSSDNIFYIFDDEPKEVTETRNRVKSLINEWISSY